MKPARTAARLVLNQAANARRILQHKPVTVVPLSGGTLDADDVALARSWLSHRTRWNNPNIVAEYEAAFAHWNGSRYALAFMAGRAALSACIAALDLQPGDEVILPGYTCVVVPNAFLYADVTPVFADIELQTYGLAADQLPRKITPRTRAILLHHLFGLVCRDYQAILDFARAHNLYVIEDCTQATGAEFRGVKVGNRADLAFYSSEQSKVFNTIQGGMAVTNNPDLARRLHDYYDHAGPPDPDRLDRQLHTLLLDYYRLKHPQRWWQGDLMNLRYGRKRLVSTTPQELHAMRPPDYGRRMAAPIAALGLNQLQKIDRYNAQRRQSAQLWQLWCRENGYQPPLVLPDSLPVFLRYPVMVEPHKKQNPQWMIDELAVTPGLWFLTHLHPSTRPVNNCPHADQAVRQCINFPTLGLHHPAIQTITDNE